MKRKWKTLVLLTALGSFGGCVGPDGGPDLGAGASGPGSYMSSHRAKGPTEMDAHNGAYQVAAVPGVVGPNGEPIPRTAPYATARTAGESAARAAFLANVPKDMISQTDLLKTGQIGGEITQVGYKGGPNGVNPTGMPSSLLQANYPSGPGCGPACGPTPPGAVAAVGALTGGGGPFVAARTSVRFVSPAGMRITWFAPTAPGQAGFGPNYLEAPARYNFSQACIYRLKLSDIPNRPGLELYPTLEVVPTNARTSTFLAHSAVPISFTEEDLSQVAAGNYVVKVVYLPDPQYQDLASTGPDEVVSSRLEPGVDPIAEAHRRGSILLVVRLGNIDLEAPNTPAMDAPSPYQAQAQLPPQGAMPQMMGAQAMGQGAGGPGAGGLPPGMMPPPGMMQELMKQGMPPPGMMQELIKQGMIPPPGMMPPDMRGPASAPTLPTSLTPPQLPPNGVPGPVGQAKETSDIKQAKFNPAKDAKSAWWWPFSKKETTNQ